MIGIDIPGPPRSLGRHAFLERSGLVAAGPVAEIRMPRRVPHGFHGVWVPAAAL